MPVPMNQPYENVPSSTSKNFQEKQFSRLTKIRLIRINKYVPRLMASFLLVNL